MKVQLARVFEKTRASRQSELARLMMRAVGVDICGPALKWDPGLSRNRDKFRGG